MRGLAKPLVAAALLLLAVSPLSSGVGSESEVGTGPTSILGDAEALESAYRHWRDGQRGGVDFPLSSWAGLTTGPLSAGGWAAVELPQGKVVVEVRGLAASVGWEAWLVDNLPGLGRSVRPEAGDAFVRLGLLRSRGGALRVQADLPNGEFEVDLVVVTPAGTGPAQGAVLVGAPGLFQKLYLQENSGVAIPGQGSPSVLGRFQTLRAYAAGPAADLAQFVAQGEDLFFNETFEGNGRTCATCHPAANDFTLDAEFIASLPADDPLFVAEFVPELSENFENPTLMRQFGLILENVDGFDDLEKKFVMRAVLPTKALATSLEPAPDGADGSTQPPDQRTGWGGDGSPGTGTLREFAIGAITQHFTRTLGREPGVDFRLPTDEELDALEAFQLSLGRQEDLDLGNLKLRGDSPARGQVIFLTNDTQEGTVAAGKCGLCHANAGANSRGANFNFDTGVENIPGPDEGNFIMIFPPPAPSALPPDGGFGRDPHPSVPGAFGNGTFNTPPLVEAADTAPFFHNHSVATLEEAVAFFSTPAFNQSPSGQFLAANDSGGIGIDLSKEEADAIAAFLRVINALENIRASTELIDRIGPGTDDEARRRAISLSVAELEDAVRVLDERGLHPEASYHLSRAIIFEEHVLEVEDGFGDHLLGAAHREKLEARRLMVADK